MGALADYAAYKTALTTAPVMANLIDQQAGLGGTSVAWGSATLNVTPTTSVAHNNTTAFTTRQFPDYLPTTLTKQLWLASCEITGNANTLYGGMMVDLLNTSGGMSAIVTTEQTTGLPTAALARHTSGVGVCIALRIFTAIGATATTVTCRYTNQDGTAGRVTKPRAFGSSASAGSILVMSLADGDTGVRSVEGVTVAATTGTAGNFGVTLFKPIFMMPMHGIGQNGLYGYAEGLQAGKMAEVLPNACFMSLTRYGSTGARALFRLAEA